MYFAEQKKINKNKDVLFTSNSRALYVDSFTLIYCYV
jgi:hypothetical protein